MENARLFNETKEALARQTATSEILRVISQSPTDARPVFERIVVTAARLLRCDTAFVLLREGDAYVHTAGATPEGPMADLAPERIPIDPSANFPSRAFLAKTMLHLPDWSQIDLPEHERRIHETFGVNSVLYLPLLRGDECIGLLAVGGRRANIFGPKEIAQAESFRDQALIAMENARLFNETQEALEHQKASGEVLRAIAQSVADTTPVFENILDASQRLFGTEEVCIFMVGEDGMVRPAAARGPGFSAARNDVMPLEGSRTGRVIRERRVHHIPDGLAEPGTPPALLERMRSSGNVSIAFAPMLWEDSGLGSIAILRRPPRPFSERELDLLRGFADQAVIAIQNARMFRETREALQQQTATAEVLKIISRSAFDLDSVLNSLTKSAVELCNSTYGVISLYRNGVLKFMAQTGCTPEFAELLWNNPASLDRKSATGRAGLLRAVVLVPDVAKDEEYDYHGGEITGNYRSMMGVPLLRNGELEGVFTLMRQEPGTFTQRQVELVQTFADQAVIAIENARLFDEVQARTRDLTRGAAAANCDRRCPQSDQPDGLRPRHRPRNADLDSGAFVRCEIWPRSSAVMETSTATQQVRWTSIRPTACMSRQLRSDPAAGLWSDASPWKTGRSRSQTPGTTPEYVEKEEARLGNVRAMLGVPLMRDGEPIGAFALARSEPVPFTRRQVELVTTFADQAVIAIENVRLFDEVQARTRELAEALQQQTATAEVLKVISRSAFDLQAVLDTLASSAVELSGASNGVIVLREGDGFRYRAFSAGMTPEFVQYLVEHPPVPVRVRAAGAGDSIEADRADRRTFSNDPDYEVADAALEPDARHARACRLLRDDRVEGAFVVTGARAGTVPATADRTRPDLRRPGRHRDRERAPVRRGAGAHARPHRGAATCRPRPPTC